jgi:hypothetical protein
MTPEEDLQATEAITETYMYVSFTMIFLSSRISDAAAAFIVLAFGVGCWISSRWSYNVCVKMRREPG